MHLSLLLPGGLDLASPADRRLELSSAAVCSRRVPMEVSERARLGIAQVAQQRNLAPVEAHQGGAGDVYHARIFTPYQQPAGLGTWLQGTAVFTRHDGIHQRQNGSGPRPQRAADIVIARDIRQVVYGAPQRIVAVPAATMNQWR